MNHLMGSPLPVACFLGNAGVDVPGVYQNSASSGLSGLVEVVLLEGREVSPFSQITC